MGKRKKKTRDQQQQGNKSGDSQQATPETLRIEIDKIFRDFLADPTATVYIFTSDLNNLQRKYIHEKSLKMDLKSRSYGKEPNRQIHIRKKVKAAMSHDVDVELSAPACFALGNYLEEHGFADGFNYQHLLAKAVNRARKANISEKVYCKIMLGKPSPVQPPKVPEHIQRFQQQLPIFGQKSEIVQKIWANQIVIISSETGSGKTTQIPQYIMERCLEQNQPCKIICTQPRRISTIAVAERVAEERGENLGNSTGYHIKLEQNYGAQTNLIYCTNGVLLRTLMQGPQALSSFTHIIIDEVHERDRLSDFLLIYLKINRPFFPNLKIILMSATLNVDKFRQYFGDAQVISVPGRLHPIQTFFLDDILPQLEFMSGEMRKLFNEKGTDADYGRWEDMNENADDQSPDFAESEPDPMIDGTLDEYLTQSEAPSGVNIEMPPQMMLYFLAENVSVNYRHSRTGMTALMIAASLGDFASVIKLLNLDADINLTCSKGLTCIDYAKLNNHNEIYDFLVQNAINKNNKCATTSNDAIFSGSGIPYLMLYDKTHRDDLIDFDLIGTLVQHIHKVIDPEVEGAILIFLPGYDDIMACNDFVERYMAGESFRVFFLHSSMTMRDQHAVFCRLQRGQRKIILSTNIAETSITIDDVCFVVDSGKAKEKCYDPNTKTSSLETLFISLSCAKQRAGRAGRTRPGMCFHLFSRHRYAVLDAERAPEMLRTSLAELCLHTKILAPDNMPISQFLNLAPDTPSPAAVKAAIERLTGLGAICDDENLTQLGEYLSQLTLEPHLAKILIYGVIFRCLEPILTLVATMSQKDPFMLPNQASLRQVAMERKRQFADDIPSDHIVYLNVFQRWQDACRNGTNSRFVFCRENFVSGATMDTILDTRKQLLAQLRAIGLVNPATGFNTYNSNANNWAMVKAVLTSGLYPNVADPVKGKLDFPHSVFPKKSANNYPRKLFIIYDEQVKKVKNVGFYLKGVTAITPLTIALIAGNQLSAAENSLLIDDWFDFTLPNDDVIKFRCRINELVMKVIFNARYRYSQSDIDLVKTVADILKFEDEQSGLVQPKNAGKRPLFFHRVIDHSANQVNQSQNQQNWRSLDQRPTKTRQVEQWRRQPSTSQNPRADNNDSQKRLRSDSLDSTPNLNWRRKVISYNDNPIYLLIRPKEVRNVTIAYTTSNWVFAPQTEKKVLKYHTDGKFVYLIFAVDKKSRNGNRIPLNGMALFDRFLSDDTKKPTALLHWIFKFDMPYDKFSRFRNPYVENRLLLDCVDGDVIQDNVAREIYRIYDEMNFILQNQIEDNNDNELDREENANNDEEEEEQEMDNNVNDNQVIDNYYQGD